MSYLSSSPDPNSLASILTKYPRRGVLLFKLLEDIGRSFSPFSDDGRELIITYASALNHCDFCYNGHQAKSAVLGINDVIIEQLQTDIDSANVDEKLKPVLRFVKKLTLTPGKLRLKMLKPYSMPAGTNKLFLSLFIYVLSPNV
jgi:AhpD family alkylhydroperoxidase